MKNLEYAMLNKKFKLQHMSLFIKLQGCGELHANSHFQLKINWKRKWTYIAFIQVSQNVHTTVKYK